MPAPKQIPPPALPGRAFQAGLAAATLCCAFVLPFLSPPTRQVYSAAYAAGSNNKLAILALALLSIATLAWTWLRKRPGAPGPGSPPSDFARGGGGLDSETWVETPQEPSIGNPLLTRTPQLLAALLIALWTAALGTLIHHSGIRYGESSYFLERTRDLLQFHPALYRQLEFPYGPLLLLPPTWLSALPPDTAFLAWLTVLNAAGILMAGYLLNRLPLTRLARRVLFALCCFEQLHPLMGPNYSLGKFLLPFAVLLWATRRSTPVRQALALAAGHLLTLLVSPELGVGLTAGIFGWAVLTAHRTRRPAPLFSLLAPIAGYAVFLALYGRGFLDRLANASAGALNLVIEPLPHIYILLFALVWLAPIAVARALRTRAPQAPVLAGFYLLSLGLLPGALGRADPLHVFFNGWGLLVLATIAHNRLSRPSTPLVPHSSRLQRDEWVPATSVPQPPESHQERARPKWILSPQILWLAALLLLGLQTQATNFHIYAAPLRALAHARPASPDYDPAALRAVTAGEPIATPALLHLPLADELTLRRANLLPLDLDAGLADVWDAPGERAKIDRLRRFQWALLPLADYTQSEGSPNDARLKVLLRLGYRYPQRRQPYQVGALLQHELATNWTIAQRFHDTVLYHRLR